MWKTLAHLGVAGVVCSEAKSFKEQFNLLLGVFWLDANSLLADMSSHVLSMGVTQLSLTLTPHTALCHPRSLSAPLPHLPGTDMTFPGMKDCKSDGSCIIPLCNAALRFVTRDDSGHVAGQLHTSILHICTMNKPQIKNCKENYQKHFV